MDEMSEKRPVMIGLVTSCFQHLFPWRRSVLLCFLISNYILSCFQQTSGYSRENQYIGCYKDNNTDRVLDSERFHPYLIDGCIKLCWKKNKTFAGVEFWNECFCGDINSTFWRHGSATNCNFTCAGSKSEFCGGENAISIYSVCPFGYYLNDTTSLNFQCPEQCGNCFKTEVEGRKKVPLCSAATGHCISQNMSDVCRRGWKGKKCDEDVDECANPELNECQNNCLNTWGSYNCSCHSGLYLNNDGSTCTDPNLMVRAGIGGGITLLVLALIFVMFFFYRRHKRLALPDQTLVTPSSSTSQTRLSIFDSVFSKRKPKPGVLETANDFTMYSCFQSGTCHKHPPYSYKTLQPLDPNFIKFWNCAANGWLKGSRAVVIRVSKRGQSPEEEECYYNFKPSLTRIKVVNLPTHYQQLKSSPAILKQQFETIPTSSVKERSDFARQSALKKKNRFKNIIPYDSNRVVLAEVNGDPLSTYINASIMQGYNIDEKIIASQGPTKDTIRDFWHMIWQFNVSVMFMLTNLEEGNKIKCEKYWPALGSGSVYYGDITVETTSCDQYSDHILCSISVRKEGGQRSIHHVQFTEWPDHGVPDDALPLLSFRQKTKRLLDPNKFTLYHCSAGAGRTCTYLAIDYLLSEAEEIREVDVLGCVTRMREQRMSAVQTLVQYRFLYQAVSEGVTVGNSYIPWSDISRRYSALRDINPVTGKTVLQTEFELLINVESSKTTRNKFSSGRNLFDSGCGVDSMRVKPESKQKGKHNYSIDGVFVRSHKNPKGFIACLPPQSGTYADDFWKLFVEHGSKLVIILTGAESADYAMLFSAQPGSVVTAGKVHINTESHERLDNHCDNYCCSISTDQNSESVYENTTANKAYASIIMASFSAQTAERYVAINSHQRRMSNSKKDSHGPVVVIGSMERCGQYIAVSNICESLDNEQYVDVIHTVLDVQKSLPYFISDPDEYSELYRAAQLHERDETRYSAQPITIYSN